MAWLPKRSTLQSDLLITCYYRGLSSSRLHHVCNNVPVRPRLLISEIGRVTRRLLPLLQNTYVTPPPPTRIYASMCSWWSGGRKCVVGLMPRDFLLSVRTHFEDKEGRYGCAMLETGATAVQLQLCRRNPMLEIMSMKRRTVVCSPLKSECSKPALSCQQNGVQYN